MSVFVTPTKPFESYSPRTPPLPVITLRSVSLQTSDYPPASPPSQTAPWITKPNKIQKNKKEDKKKKKTRPKRSKSCPPIETDSKKKVRLPVVDGKQKNSKDVSNSVSFVHKKSGKSAPPVPRANTDIEKTMSGGFGSGTMSLRTTPPTPPPRVRLITLAKLKEEDIRDKLRQTVFNISTRSKPGEAGLIVVEGNTNKKVDCKPYQIPATQGIFSTPKSVLKENANSEEQPTAILKHRKFAFTKKCDDPKKKECGQSTDLRSKSVSKLTKDTEKALDSTEAKSKTPNQSAKKSSNNSSTSDTGNIRTQTSTDITRTISRPSSNMPQKSITPIRSIPRHPSTNLSPAPQDSSTREKSPKKKNISLLVKIKPINQESEREKFFDSNFHHNPQFVYRNLASANEMEKFSQASGSLLHIVSAVQANP